MKKLFVMLLLTSHLSPLTFAQTRVSVTATTAGTSPSPTNFFTSNILAGAGIEVTPTNAGRVIISAPSAGLAEIPPDMVASNSITTPIYHIGESNQLSYMTVSNGYFRLYVSNRMVFSINLTNGSWGVNTVPATAGAAARGIDFQGHTPPTTDSGNGTSGVIWGGIRLIAGSGGDTTDTVDRTGGLGGSVQFIGGSGGASASVTNNTGGNGGAFAFNAGVGHGPSVAASNTMGGSGGALTLNAGAGGAPSAGTITRRGGPGGAVTITAGTGANSTSTNGGSGGQLSLAGGGGGSGNGSGMSGGDGGPVVFTAGNSGGGSSGANGGRAGYLEFLGGSGSSGNSPGTNANGGNLFLAPGSATAPAVAGEIVLGSTASGTERGSVRAVAPIKHKLNSSSAPTSLTNHIADFNKSYATLAATNDLNFLHSTNREASLWKSAVIKIYTGPTNRQVWLNPSWTPLGSTTNYTVLASNKIAILSLAQDGSSETNVAAVLTVQP